MNSQHLTHGGIMFPSQSTAMTFLIMCSPAVSIAAAAACSGVSGLSRAFLNPSNMMYAGPGVPECSKTFLLRHVPTRELRTCQLRKFFDELALCFGIAIPVMSIFLFEIQFQSAVVGGGIGMYNQIIPEI